MDEQDWAACDDPEKMVSFLRVSGRLSDRKGRLFAVACCRRLLPRVRVDPADVHAVDVAERYAEGEATAAELEAARRYVPGPPSARRTAAFACRDAMDTEYGAEQAADCTCGNAAWAADEQAASLEGGASDGPAFSAARATEYAAQAALLHDIFGPLPFRPLPPLDPSVRAWDDGCVVKLATAAYTERSLPEGTLDPHQLAVLADAQEEAGADAELVGHLRGPGPHVCGCHILDVILGKE